MIRLVRRIAIAAVSPALAVALVQVASDTASSGSGQQHTASGTKVCLLNPVWGDNPCLS